MTEFDVILDKAYKNGMKIRWTNTEGITLNGIAIKGMTWEEIDDIVEEYIAEKQEKEANNTVDKRLKNQYRKNRKYYDSCNNNYYINDIMDAYNESKGNSYY